MTRTFEALLRRGVDAAIASGALPSIERPTCVIEEPEDPRFGDATSRVAMGVARRTGRPALAVARDIVAHVADPDGSLEAIEAAGPGFINLRASLALWRGALADRLATRPSGGADGRVIVLSAADEERAAGGRVAFQAGLLARLLRAAGADVTSVAGDVTALARLGDAPGVSRAVVVHGADVGSVARRAKDAFEAAGGDRGRVAAIPVAPCVVRHRGRILAADQAAAAAATPAGRLELASVPASVPAELDAERLGVDRIDDPYFAVRYALARIGRSTRPEGVGPGDAFGIEERDRECARGVGTHGDVVRRSARRLAPEAVALHGRALAAAFHRHYNRAGFDGADARRGRAAGALAAGIAGVLEDVLALAGACGS